MLKNLLFLLLTLLAFGASAEIFSCKSPGGKTEYSDTPCKAGSTSELVPDRDSLTQQQKDDAQKKLEQQKRQASDLAARRSAAQPPREIQAAAPPAAPVDEVGGGCSDGRGRSNCAGNPYPRPLPDKPGPRPRPR